MLNINQACYCINGKKYDPSTRRCVNCNSKCKSCYGIAPNECLDCRSGQFLSAAKTCDCKPGFTLSGNDCVCNPPKIIDKTIPGSEKCDSCDPSCSTCAITANNCSSCPATKILHQGACIDSCPENGFYYHPYFKRCAQCQSSCSKCSESSKNC